MNKILVYMATYNGSKYIDEQIESILNQDNVVLDLWISDDCSTDDTIEKLYKYAAIHDNIFIFRNETNLGYKKNFLSLIQREIHSEYDYFALADQDDVWDRNKLISGIEFIKENNVDLDDNTPMAYSSNLTVVNENLDVIGSLNSPEEVKKFTNLNLLLENKCTGCTLIFNNALRKIVLDFPVERIKYPHDELICKLAIIFGKYYFDVRSFIKYRQHSNNQIGAGNRKNIFKYFKMLFSKTNAVHSQCFADLIDIYSDINSSIFYSYIDKLAKYRQKFRYKLQIFFSKKYRKTTIRKTMIFKFAILFGKY